LTIIEGAGQGSGREAGAVDGRPPIVERRPGLVAIIDPAAPDELRGLDRAGLERLVARAGVLKDGDRCTVGRFEIGGRPLVIKRFNRKGLFHTVTHLLLRSRAAWCWRNGRRLHAHGVATPVPLAAYERRFGPFRLESYLVTTYVEGPMLIDLVLGDASAPVPIDDLVEEFAQVWRVLGSLRARHHDMKATNFIVGPDRRLWLVDLDGLRAGIPAPFWRRARRLDLERFLRNWQGRPEVAAIFRARLDRDEPRG
jgi:hypothetical protein